MTNRYKTILLFGAPGAGKGTQGKVLGMIPGFFHFACGDVFRQIDITSKLGKIFYDFSSRGELVPDDITVKMWAESIHAHTILQDYKPRHDLLILDGIPRTVEQAKIMQKHIEVMIFGSLIIFFLIVEPNGLARMWQIAKEKLRRWPFPY